MEGHVSPITEDDTNYKNDLRREHREREKEDPFVFSPNLKLPVTGPPTRPNDHLLKVCR